MVVVVVGPGYRDIESAADDDEDAATIPEEEEAEEEGAGLGAKARP